MKSAIINTNIILPEYMIPNGTIVINLEDGNSIIIDENGYRVIKTNKELKKE